MKTSMRCCVVGIVSLIWSLAPALSLAQPAYQLGVNVTWTAPTTNVDGQPIDADLAGFDLCFRFAPFPAGNDSANFDDDCTIAERGLAPDATSFAGAIPSAVATGTLYVRVVAYDTAGQRSPYSPVGTAAFDFDAAPGAPGTVTVVITTTITTVTGSQ